MPPNKPRQQGITRPRPSLSCVVCKRRKVRCGKEQPFCTNCTKEPEACKYDYDIHHRSTKETTRNNYNGNATAEARAAHSALQVSESPSLNRMPYQSLPPANSQISNVETSSMVGHLPRHPAGSANSLSTYIMVDERHGDTERHLLHPHAGGSNAAYPQTRDQSSSLQRMAAWEQGTQEDFGNSLQWSNLPPTSNMTFDSLFEAPRKRYRSSDLYTVSQRLENNGHEEVHEAAAHKQKKTRASNHREAASPSENLIHPFGYLSVQNGGQSRFVGDTFWGLIKGHEDLCESFLAEKQDVPEIVVPPHIDAPGLAVLLTTMPKKEVCDSLLRSFSISVQPVHPLVQLPTFQTDYSNFWQWFSNSDISLPDSKIIGDPTFLCLMFAILYCGAAASPPEIWTTSSLQNLQKEKIVEDLRKTFSASLKMCQHLRHPTISTLTSSILAHSCTESNAAHMEDLGFVHMTVRVAQSMGLHRDGSSFGLDAVSCEMRRRIWWHVVWLDVQSSILHGSQVCLGTSEVHSDVAMVSEIRDQDLSSQMVGLALKTAPPPSGATSVAMLLAQARYETSKFKRSLVDHYHSGGNLGQGQLDDLISAAKSVQARLDQITERIPTQGLSGANFIPSHFINASPTTHEWLYSDTIGQDTVCGTWARVMIVMLKTDVAISVQKPFLGRADSRSKQQQSMWNRIVQLSLTYLQNFMQLVHIPAFAPYSWFCKNCLPPLQPLFLTLTYLQYNREWGDMKIALHLVDGTFDFFTSADHGSIPDHANDNNTTAPSNKEIPLVWRMLISLRRKLDLPLGMERPIYEPIAPVRCHLVSPDGAQQKNSLAASDKSGSSLNTTTPSYEATPTSFSSMHTSPTANPPVNNGEQVNAQVVIDANNPLDMSDLDMWCASLLQDPGLSPLG